MIIRLGNRRKKTSEAVICEDQLSRRWRKKSPTGGARWVGLMEINSSADCPAIFLESCKFQGCEVPSVFSVPAHLLGPVSTHNYAQDQLAQVFALSVK